MYVHTKIQGQGPGEYVHTVVTVVPEFDQIRRDVVQTLILILFPVSHEDEAFCTGIFEELMPAGLIPALNS